MFWLKKILSAFLLPMPFTLIAGVLGIALLFTRRWKRAGQVLLAFAVLALLVASNRWVSNRLSWALESSYAAMPEYSPGAQLPASLAACRYVVVLGSGHSAGSDWPALTRLCASGRARLVEGVRVLRLVPAAQLVVSGPIDNEGPAHARILADAAVSLGVERSRIVLIEDALDTEQEVARVRRIAGDAPVALITSAWHMPRAMALGAAAGLHAVPCPADFLTIRSDHWHLSDYSWDVKALEQSNWAVHEFLGLWWAKLRGKA